MSIFQNSCLMWWLTWYLVITPLLCSGCSATIAAWFGPHWYASWLQLLLQLTRRNHMCEGLEFALFWWISRKTFFGHPHWEVRCLLHCWHYPVTSLKIGAIVCLVPRLHEVTVSCFASQYVTSSRLVLGQPLQTFPPLMLHRSGEHHGLRLLWLMLHRAVHARLPCGMSDWDDSECHAFCPLVCWDPHLLFLRLI